MKKFTEEHEWVEVNGELATIGITSHAAQELGDMTFVELPDVGTEFAQGDVLSVVESVKAASDVYSPLSGTVRESNSKLEENPEIINASPEEDGWICKLSNFNPDELIPLMTEGEYADFIV